LKKARNHAGIYQLAKSAVERHPDRPYTLKYIEKMCDNFIELFGDRNVRDDKAMVGGFAQLAGQTVMMIGQQKGTIQKCGRCVISVWPILRLSKSVASDETGGEIRKAGRYPD